VSWPPQIGEVLPRGEDAYGGHEKLAGYSLHLEHPRGRAKAAGFAAVLGITAIDLNYLADAVLSGVRSAPVSEVRDRGEHGIVCKVVVPVRGLGEHADRVANVLTSWHLRWDGDAPRLVSAYITTKVV
jgi:hypothetical protein